MKNRTYRYFAGQPLYPFGHGLSYTRFEYSGLALDKGSVAADGSVQVDSHGEERRQARRG